VDLGFDAGARFDAEMLASCLPSRYHACSRSLLWREPMHLLVIITRQEDKACDFLNLLPTVGVRGATVIEGRGMGKILRDRETIFTSIEQILSASIDLTDNVVILSLVEGGEVLARARRFCPPEYGCSLRCANCRCRRACHRARRGTPGEE